MANLSEDELQAMERAHRTDEAERCALLAEDLAQRWEKAARKMRDDGTYFVRAIWPPFRKTKCIMPNWEKAAKDMDSAAHGLRTVARACREGWDTRNVQPDCIFPKCLVHGTEKSFRGSECICDQVAARRKRGAAKAPDETTFPCIGCTAPMDCGSWQCCEQGRGDWPGDKLRNMRC